MPRCFGTSQFVRATSIPYSASLPLDVHTFCPLTTHSSPSRSARVCSPARSEPAPGSEYSRHIFTSSTSRRRTNRSLRASVPYARTVFAHRLCLSCAAPGRAGAAELLDDHLGRLAVEAAPEPLGRPRRHGVPGIDDERRATPCAADRAVPVLGQPGAHLRAQLVAVVPAAVMAPACQTTPQPPWSATMMATDATRCDELGDVRLLRHADRLAPRPGRVGRPAVPGAGGRRARALQRPRAGRRAARRRRCATAT